MTARSQYFLQWPVDDFEAAEIKRSIQDNDSLDIYISSIGGSVNNGFEIVNLIQAAEKNGKDIRTHILSNADSIASVIFLAPKKDKRYIVENSTMFVHEPRFMFGIDIDKEKADKMSEELEIQKNRIADFYVKSIEGLDKKEALALMAGEKNLTAQEMLDYGIVGEVKEVLDIAAQRSSFNLNRNTMGLFDKKKPVNQVISGENTFIFEGDLAKGSELTQVGVQDAKLEGEHVLNDGRTLVVDSNNKVADIKPKEVVEDNSDEAIIAAVTDLITDLEKRMDEKIDNLRKSGSSHKPPKGDGTGGAAQKTTSQNVAEFKGKLKEAVEARRNS